MSDNNDIVPGFDEEKDDTINIRLQKVVEAEGCVVLYLTGYIDTYNSNFFQKRVNRVIEAGYTRLVFQCSGLNYVSSTGIGSFTAFLKAVKPRNGDLVLLEIQPKVYEVFQLLGFAQFFNIKDSIDEAVAYFAQGFGSSDTSIFPKIFKCPICSTKLKAGRSGRFR
ncbi:MAG: STAS domain-containing protein, partial [Salinispira sp.]